MLLSKKNAQPVSKNGNVGSTTHVKTLASTIGQKDCKQIYPKLQHVTANLKDLTLQKVDSTQQELEDANEQMKSFCKVQGHGVHEIVFACYECRDTFCSQCIESH